ncbi:MAG: hypothetical protein U0163_20840 [Gemmatimonadaceae bacterium]
MPEALVEDVIKALSKRLASVTMGDPSVEGVKMGPLAGTRPSQGSAQQPGPDQERRRGGVWRRRPARCGWS